MYHADFDLTHNVKPGKHFYQFYKSTEDYLKIMAQFFRAGLEKGEACLWLVSEKIGVRETQMFADQSIPRYLYYSSSGQFKIQSAEQWYLKGDRFDEEQALQNAINGIGSFLQKGYHRVRGAGDISAVPRMDWPLLDQYEHKMDGIINGAPVIAVCAYPILECSLKETRMVLDAHRDVLVGHL